MILSFGTFERVSLIEAFQAGVHPCQDAATGPSPFKVSRFHTATILVLVAFDNLRHRTPPPVARNANRYAINFLYNQ
jgi:hypothetical protein